MYIIVRRSEKRVWKRSMEKEHGKGAWERSVVKGVQSKFRYKIRLHSKIREGRIALPVGLLNPVALMVKAASLAYTSAKEMSQVGCK
jgi:hypothetical protein